jgi:hypothetical protein
VNLDGVGPKTSKNVKILENYSPNMLNFSKNKKQKEIHEIVLTHI